MDKVILVVLTALLCIGCQHPTLSVKMRSFDRNDLASCIVDTPDPTKESPVFGQRLYIHWYLPQQTDEPVTLQIGVRFENDTETQEVIPVTSRWGSYLWMIKGKEYAKSGGILAYRIALVANGKTLAESKHKFWAEKIQID